jgi:hypothetical protein
MKRFILTRIFLALKESQDVHPAKWEEMYDEFRDVVMESALKMDKFAYCFALNCTLAELKFLKKESGPDRKKMGFPTK